ncbi:LysR family transcriptional regulator [Enhygromyxa salina]|uniref:HTH-type transcriptional regulator DmlR n=1 Tax=Enhygromyxa salina TaxID=215803 RepID=A0A2S9Y5S8_9BACT|nr:LysR family transcriptional regulator [Enhygromyxa salina]PRQ00442.1 HTH-type transcriptional regulator DmlR [Enhygromyxa salina]
MDRLTAMEALVRVVDAGSFSAAARQWGRSKAVVSKYISALEGELGVELLRRTTRSLSLTEAGRAYHPRCRALLVEIDALESSLRDEQQRLRGSLRVTAPPGLADRYLEQLTTSFVANHPELRIDLDLTHRMVDLVEDGVDVAIRLTTPRDSTLVARRIAPAPLVAVASPAYLRARGTPTDPTQLREHECLVDTNFRDQQRWRFEVNGSVRTVSVDGPFRVNSPAAIRELALAGHGIALIPAMLVEPELESGRLVEVLAGTVALTWSLLAVYPRKQYLSARVRAYVDHLAAVMSP